MSLPSIQEFEQVLVNILAPNNDLRNQAETHFNNSKQHPDYCIQSLLHILRNSPQTEIRGLACVLLRKCISSEDSLYTKVTNETKQKLKSELLEALKNETVDHNRSKLVYTLTGFVSGLLENNEFPEFMPTMFDWAKNPSPVLRENALGVFNHLSDYLAHSGLSPYLVHFRQIFEANLRDLDNPIVRLAAVEATCAIIMVLDKQQYPAFQDLIPDMLQTIAQLLNAKDYQSAGAAIECFIEIAVSKPGFFTKHANNIIAAMFQIAKTADLDDSVRHLATEFMISLTEKSPSLIKKIPSFVDNLFPLCMSLMLDIEHDDDWQDTYEDEDMDLSNYDVGLESLDRLALALGGKVVQPVAFKLIPTFLNNQDWKHRHTGLMTISQTAEGCQEEYEAHLAQIVTMVVALFQDPHPRVRYAAIHCSAQLATDFQPGFQQQFHAQVVPALLGGMDDPFPKVQSHAATAVVNFVDECDRKYVEPYLDHILTKLLNLLRTGRRYVQEQSLSAISAVADCAEHLFQKYYDAIIPFLKQILLNANGKQDRMLRARAIECVSLIGVAVGKEKFGKDAQEIMELLMRTQQGGFEDDDPQYQHILQAWSRIAKCLGPDFVPYLNYVMPPLLKSAELQPDVIVTDIEDEDDLEEEEGMESFTLTLKGSGAKKISIRTSTLEEKGLACNMLFTYVAELKEHFLPFIEPVAKVMIPLLKFPYWEDIRETAATIMPQLLNSIKLAAEKKLCDAQLLKQLLDGIFTQLVDAIKTEMEVRTATILVEALNDCIKVVGENCLGDAQLLAVSELFKTVILSSIERKQAVIQELQKEDDEEQQAVLDEDALCEEQFLTIIAETVGGILKTHKAFIPYFIRDLWPIYSGLLGNTFGDDEHRIGLCVICDFVENSGTASHQFFELIVPALFNYAKSDNPEVRQAAVFGIGACAQYAGEAFEPAVPPAIEALIHAINRPDSKKKEHKAATANAISALFKFLQFRASNQHVSANVSNYKNVWLQALPVGGDIIEAKIVHGHLVSLIQQNDQVILGQYYANIPKILQVFADIVNTGLVSVESQASIKQILQQLSTQPQMMSQAMTTLSVEQQNKLKDLVAK